MVSERVYWSYMGLITEKGQMEGVRIEMVVEYGGIFIDSAVTVELRVPSVQEIKAV